MVVSEVHGTWHRAIDVPGTVTVNAGEDALVKSVSCASAGNCSAGGFYTDSLSRSHMFVVSQVRGTWHKAIKVPGTATLNTAGRAEVDSVSCTSAGNCSAGGLYEVSVDGGAAGPLEVFVVSEVKGTWHKAIEIPGTATLNHGDAAFGSMSCASPGNCAAGGFYSGRRDHREPFVVSQVKGTWHKAVEVPAPPRSTSADWPRSRLCPAPRPANASPSGSTPASTVVSTGS